MGELFSVQLESLNFSKCDVAIAGPPLTRRVCSVPFFFEKENKNKIIQHKCLKSSGRVSAPRGSNWKTSRIIVPLRSGTCGRVDSVGTNFAASFLTSCIRVTVRKRRRSSRRAAMLIRRPVFLVPKNLLCRAARGSREKT